MGSACFCNRSASVSPEMAYINRTIDKSLAADYKKLQNVFKCVLLGAGDCGKSTLLKQIRLLHNCGFDAQERIIYRSLIYKNMLESLHILYNACQQLRLPIQNQHAADRIIGLNPVEFPEDLISAYSTDMKNLWADSGIQMAYTRKSEFHCLESAQYFFLHADRILIHNYVPNDQDILRSRLNTTGIMRFDFKHEQFTFQIFDVGGQRGERKKWIHCFQDVAAIFFIASLSEYDQVLAEDQARNRLKESLNLFEGIVNLPWFSDVPIVLFLNKDDIFREKVQHVDIGIYFPQYVGGCNYDAGLKFIRECYFQRNENPSKTIYCHVTNSTNSDNIDLVWRSSKHVILERNLMRTGLMV